MRRNSTASGKLIASPTKTWQPHRGVAPTPSGVRSYFVTRFSVSVQNKASFSAEKWGYIDDMRTSRWKNNAVMDLRRNSRFKRASTLWGLFIPRRRISHNTAESIVQGCAAPQSGYALDKWILAVLKSACATGIRTMLYNEAIGKFNKSRPFSRAVPLWERGGGVRGIPVKVFTSLPHNASSISNCGRNVATRGKLIASPTN